MGDDFLLLHLIIFCAVDGFSAKQVFQGAPCAFAIDIHMVPDGY